MTENEIEQLCLGWLKELGWEYIFGPDLLPDETGCGGERVDDKQVLLLERLRTQVDEINPHIPPEAVEDAVKQVEVLAKPNLITTNLAFHRMLTEGVDVSYQDANGDTKYDKCWLVDWNNVEMNDLLAVNQFTVRYKQQSRRPDIVLFINGIPFVVIELKNPTDEKATLKKAWHQLQTYHSQIPTLHQYTGIEIVSDGLQARYGTLSAGLQHYSRWPTIDGTTLFPAGSPELEPLVKGLLQPQRLLSVIRDYIVFEGTRGEPIKIAAKYHQVFAVEKAVVATIAAINGDHRAGVVWHTQGAGKSLEMVFYSGLMSRHPSMENPTIVVLTDRLDLDSQLFGTFSACQQLLRQTPKQAESRDDLQELLSARSGGIVFTTIQKFFPKTKGETYPTLSTRNNIIVIADEAHRSQYDFIDGFARHMRDALPNASFLGFTGTPIELSDKNTAAVFGDYVDIYDIERAVIDGATVPIYYEGRLAKIQLDEKETPRIDEEFEELTEDQENEDRERVKTKWAAMEALVGSKERIALVAEDLVAHFETRQEAMLGKGMIVVMSRRIAVDLYSEIVKLRPDWHKDADDEGVIKVVMTGSASDPLDWQGHIRNKAARESLAIRFKDPETDFKLVIVRDMWLTGFDAPCLHTMYLDKPMQNHGLMQAIARVNRVFHDKPGGLVVDYLGLAQNLREALATYTCAGGKGTTSIPIADAIAVLQEKLEILRDLFHGFEYNDWFGGDTAAKLALLPAAADFILGLEDGDKRLRRITGELSKAFALCSSTDEAKKVRDEVGFFQAVRATIVKASPPKYRSDDEIDAAVKQLVDAAVQPDEVIDIFKNAGLDRPDIAILSDEFLEELRNMPQKNLALETLKRLLEGSIRESRKTNIVESRKFSELLQRTILRYQNRSIEAAVVIGELIQLAKDMAEAHHKGEAMGLTIEEKAFYDALADNPSAIEMGDDTLKKIAQELLDSVRKNVTVDWSIRESAQAHMRVVVKRLLRKYKYPPDAQDAAVKLVLEQATLMGEALAA